MSPFDKNIEEILRIYYNSLAGIEVVMPIDKKTTIKNIKQLIEKYVIGENIPIFGPQNEAGHVSLEDYENNAVNSKLDEQRQILWGNKS